MKRSRVASRLDAMASKRTLTDFDNHSLERGNTHKKKGRKKTLTKNKQTIEDKELVTFDFFRCFFVVFCVFFVGFFFVVFCVFFVGFFFVVFCGFLCFFCGCFFCDFLWFLIFGFFFF